MSSGQNSQRARGMIRMCCIIIGMAVVTLVLPGCLSITVDEPLVDADVRGEPAPVDTRRVPPTSSHEEARQKLAEAYAYIDARDRRISKLDSKVGELKADLKRAKKQRDEYKDYKEYKEKNEDYKRKYREYKDKYEDCQEKYKKLKKSLDD